MYIIKQPLFAVACLLLLAGCGGGGGSGGGANSGVSQSALNNAAEMARIRMAASTFAGATPVSGSVTQTSNVDGTGVTEDQITAEATYNAGGSLGIEIEHTAADDTVTTIGTSDTVLHRETVTGTNTGTDFELRTLGKSVNGGTVFVNAYTNRMNAADTDYLVGGVWLFVPDSGGVNDFEIGAFADGPNADLTPSAYLQTPATANYNGDAAGVYLGVDSGGGYGGDFGADVTLTTAFGTTPTISGTVHTILVRDFDEDDYSPIPDNPTITLGTATIGATAGGFFTGDSSGTVSSSGMTYTYAGKWGGQFYGAQAETVGGTFGASVTSNVPNELEYFVGAFFAEKQ